MATKAELEQDCVEYNRHLDLARNALQQGDIIQAVEAAVASWPFIDGMMQFERKYGGREFDTIAAIEIVLKIAPLVFDRQNLDRLEQLLREKKRIDKNTNADLANKLAEARRLMREAHRLWCHVEQQPNCRQDELRRILEGDQDRWRQIAEAWHGFGLLRKTPEANTYRLGFITNMEDHVSGKCPACGIIGKARKEKFLESAACPKCKETVHFVIIASP